eukprot:762518-Hanusia_phi.AAC.4
MSLHVLTTFCSAARGVNSTDVRNNRRLVIPFRVSLHSSSRAIPDERGVCASRDSKVLLRAQAAKQLCQHHGKEMRGRMVLMLYHQASYGYAGSRNDLRCSKHKLSGM